MLQYICTELMEHMNALSRECALYTRAPQAINYLVQLDNKVLSLTLL